MGAWLTKTQGHHRCRWPLARASFKPHQTTPGRTAARCDPGRDGSSFPGDLTTFFHLNSTSEILELELSLRASCLYALSNASELTASMHRALTWEALTQGHQPLQGQHCYRCRRAHTSLSTQHTAQCRLRALMAPPHSVCNPGNPHSPCSRDWCQW